MEHIRNARFAQGFEDETRDLPYLAGFDVEAVEMLSLIGVEDNGSLPDQAFGNVLVNALVGLREGRWTSYSRREGFYAGLDRYHATMRCRMISKAVERAESLGLIEHEKAGDWSLGWKGLQSRFRASDRFANILNDHRLMQRRSVIRPNLREVLQLRDIETGKLMPYRETGRTRDMRQAILDYNADLARRVVEIGDDRVVRLGSGLLEVPTKDGRDTFLVRERFSYVRQFSGGWDRHGRFYGPHWQSCPKPVRGTITIDGAKTGRLDYGNSHFRLAYAEAGIDPGKDDDAYRVRGYEDDAGRRLMKIAGNTAINASGRDEAIKAVAFSLAEADHKRETGSKVGARIGAFDMGVASDVVAAVERRHPALDRIFYTGAGMRFMATEANVMAGVIKEARRYEIPVLSIHDETMFPADRAAIIENLMYDQWNKRVSVPALVMP